jgi:hypothetical protein
MAGLVTYIRLPMLILIVMIRHVKVRENKSLIGDEDHTNVDLRKNVLLILHERV